jgi:hypothetical protein
LKNKIASNEQTVSAKTQKINELSGKIEEM